MKTIETRLLVKPKKGCITTCVEVVDETGNKSYRFTNSSGEKLSMPEKFFNEFFEVRVRDYTSKVNTDENE